MLKSRREAYRESLREDILNAARQLFAVHGYEATSIRAIAQQVGASPGIIYHYFEDKPQIMAVLVRETFAKLGARLSSIVSDGDEVIPRLRRGLRAYIEFGLEFPHHYTLLFVKAEMIEIHPVIHEAFMQDGMKVFGCLLSLSEEAIAARVIRPDLKDHNEMAQMLWVSIHGLVATQIGIRTFPWIERFRLIDRQVETLVAGVLKKT